MKNNMEGSIFKKKGFFIALYSSLGAVMVLALVISITNMSPSTSDSDRISARNEMTEGSDDQDETTQVAADQVQSYLTQAELDEQAWLRPRATEPPQPPTPPHHMTPTTPTRPPAYSEPAALPETPAPAVEPAAPETPAAPEADATVETEATNAGIAFAPFSENDKMVWPVAGEVAMVFSMDRLVYDPTLDQYRTNDDLRITAKEGTPVKAGFDGSVLSVGRNNVYGHYVSIDHGNGYIATYGQLMDGVLVAEGESVKSGQVIGGVGRPSHFGSLNGTHVNLRVTKDDMPIDPRDILLTDGQ